MILYGLIMAFVTIAVILTLHAFFPDFRRTVQTTLSYFTFPVKDREEKTHKYKSKRKWVPDMEEKDSWRILFYELGLMPCCRGNMKFFEGPRGGMATNIKCAHCSHKWNITPGFAQYIENIGGALPVMVPDPSDPHNMEIAEMRQNG